ncbi:relaxase domain-containing protein [Streptomyces sp. NPDC015032]|uniref:relaxase domain-containing protein n=1 Tax=Streptomyces sp. NPDC015032 TaxID=3364937 RepID=UPI00370077D8
MISQTKIRPGDGRYLFRGVMVGDGHRAAGTSLRAAQAEAGVPPGIWKGRGLAAVGLKAGDVMTERQAELLLREGRHPDADRIERERLAEGSARVPRILDTYSGEPVCRRPHSAAVNGRFALVVAFRRGTGKVK